MEYTIDNETLVYYALRNEHGKYYCEDNICKQGSLKDCTMFSHINFAKEAQEHYPEFKEIRKVKVIDIGELNENI